MKIKKAIITAAGFGSRFLPAVKNVPKEMLPIIDKPILHYQVEECLEAGIEEVIIVVRRGNNVIRDYFYGQAEDIKQLLIEQGKEDRYQEIEKLLSYKNIRIIDQDPQLPYGNGSPIVSARMYLEPNEAFVMIWGDDLVLTQKESATQQLINYYQTHSCDNVLAVQKLPREELVRYGVIKPKSYDAQKGEGQVEYLVEKPDLDKLPSEYVSYGRMIISYKIFKYLTPNQTGKDSELWLQDANDKLAKSGKVMFKEIDGEWMTTGDPVRYLYAVNKYYLASEKYRADTKEMLKKVVSGFAEKK